MLAFIGSLATTFVVGGAGWYATSFFAKPVRDFYDLRAGRAALRS
jgi:hypothetical protein